MLIWFPHNSVCWFKLVHTSTDNLIILVSHTRTPSIIFSICEWSVALDTFLKDFTFSLCDCIFMHIRRNSVIYIITCYCILPIKSTCPNKCTGPIFHSYRGNGQRKCHEKLVKLPPRRSKKSETTYLSSCRVCKPALNSAILAVPLCSRGSYLPHDRTIDQLTIFPHAGL